MNKDIVCPYCETILYFQTNRPFSCNCGYLQQSMDVSEEIIGFYINFNNQNNLHNAYYCFYSFKDETIKFVYDHKQIGIINYFIKNDNYLKKDYLEKIKNLL